MIRVGEIVFLFLWWEKLSWYISPFYELISYMKEFLKMETKYIKSKQKLNILKFIFNENIYDFLPEVPENV